MKSQREDLVCVTEAEQARSKKWTSLEVKGLAHVFNDLAPDFVFARVRRAGAQIRNRQREVLFSRDELDWLSRFVLRECRAKDLVPSDKFSHGSLECCNFQNTTQPDREGNVVGILPRFQLVQKPQPLLRKGRWEDK